MRLPTGLYEAVVTERLRTALSALPSNRYVAEYLDSGDSHTALSQHLANVVASALDGLQGDERLRLQADLVNALIDVLAERTGEPDVRHEGVVVPSEQLVLVHPPSVANTVLSRSARDDDEEPEWPHPERPDTPLSLGCILTGNTRVDPSLLSQLQKELATADRVDILCSFIKWGGVRVLRDALAQFTSRPDSRLRVITTSYIGATDPKAIEYLSQLPHSEVRVSYDTKHTRLHAKAYMFTRDTGFSSAYVGSANLSHAAITEGLEWTVKVSQRESNHLWEKLTGTFEAYWNDAEFCLYTEAERPRLVEAIERERGWSASSDDSVAVLFDLAPHDFQREILDRISDERALQSKYKHLIVAATGTGKTMIAAFDYRRWSAGRARPRLLFIAHREEILKQALTTFRNVLRERNFGELYFGGQQPDSLDHLFCTIQTYNSRQLTQLPPDHFEYVVVDEFHHAAAESYRAMLDHLCPKVLLGLTATPERADLQDVFAYFGGKSTAEIRLPDAVTRKLLCPFQYFGITDCVDLNDLAWKRGAYVGADLETKYNGNGIRAQLIMDTVGEVLTDSRRARGIGFCVGVHHAAYMAKCFNEAGIPAAVLTGESSRDLRESVQQRLRSREINFIFTVDLYNEGVDIPEVDTVLFLRPTESLTVFLQQLGRGLRHHRAELPGEAKDCLTVLDFVGRQHTSFRFDRRFRALLTDPTRNVTQELERGFPHLPAGCSITLERQAREHILENIRQAVISSKRAIKREYSDVRTNLGRQPSLEEFLRAADLAPIDLYRRDVSLSRLAAGESESVGDDEQRLTKGLARLCHIDDPHWIRTLIDLIKIKEPLPNASKVSEATRRYIAMAHQSLWYDTHQCASVRESIERLQSNPALAQELVELLRWNLERIAHIAPIPSLPFECPLALHCRYTLHEALAGLGHWTLSNRPRFTEGPLSLKHVPADAFFVTLNKTEADYSPTTMYKDYAVSDRVFHWQSQSTTTEDGKVGRRYREHVARQHAILLFVRENARGVANSNPYHYLGPARYLSHTGSKPMSILWQIDNAMPASVLRVSRRLID